MRISEARRLQLLTYASGVMASRPPDLEINDGYVQRWMVWPRNRWGNIYIHKFNGDDTDGALHDHEPDNVSIILENNYREHFHTRPKAIELVNGQRRFKTYSELRLQGDVVGRLAGTPHRIELVDKPVITLFLMGPRRRKWGFHCTSSWIPWDEYIDVRNGYGDRSGMGCPP